MSLEEDKKCYPPFLVKEFEKSRKRLERERNQKEVYSYNPTKITDFLPLIHCIWKISNKGYQEQYWGKRGQWGDNYMETLETFSGDARASLKTNKEELITMTPKQREMLQKLYDMIDFFTEDPEAPGSDYGENDEAIVNDPKWLKIGEYAKIVYEELSGDDLDEWEAQRKKRQL